MSPVMSVMPRQFYRRHSCFHVMYWQNTHTYINKKFCTFSSSINLHNMEIIQTCWFFFFCVQSYISILTKSTQGLQDLLKYNNNNHIQRRKIFDELSPARTLKWPEHNHVQIMRNTLSAYNVQHVVLCATWYEGTAQLLRQSLNHIYFSFI